MGDQGEISCESLTGDENVVWSDGSPSCVEDRAYLTGVTRIFFVEIHDIEIQVVDGVEIYGDPSPLVCAEKQFMENDDR